MIEYYIDAVKHKNDEMLYRSYISDCLKAIANGTYTKPVIDTRYIDLALPPKVETVKTENKNAVEVAKDILKKAARKGGRTI